MREARREDQAQVSALWLKLVAHHRALAEDFPVLPGIASVIASEVRRAASQARCRLLVAERGAELVGFLFAEIESGAGPGGESPPAWIHELWVEPELRRQGVAARLLAACDAFFAERGVARVSVRVERSNGEGLAFWERRGFAERARILERVS